MRLDLSEHGYALIIVDTGGSHATLTAEYASVAGEMRKAAEILQSAEGRTQVIRTPSGR